MTDVLFIVQHKHIREKCPDVLVYHITRSLPRLPPTDLSEFGKYQRACLRMIAIRELLAR